MGRLPPDAVIVLDINKLATEKKGDGITVPTSAFADGRNLVFVDEGHKGQKSEASVWKALQADLAGIDAPTAAQRGSPRTSPNCLLWPRPPPSFCRPTCASVLPPSG